MDLVFETNTQIKTKLCNSADILLSLSTSLRALVRQLPWTYLPFSPVVFNGGKIASQGGDFIRYGCDFVIFFVWEAISVSRGRFLQVRIY